LDGEDPVVAELENLGTIKVLRRGLLAEFIRRLNGIWFMLLRGLLRH
jgi:hypothetical protein